jgi:hypothetical protein
MNQFRLSPRSASAGVVAVLVGIGVALVPAGAATADTTIDGPIDLGTATAFSVLGASTVTNTGPSVLSADLGLSPGTSIIGFPPGLVGGTTHATDAVAAQAQVDLTTAYNVAASLTPTTTGLTDLVDLSLAPGVYSGQALSLSGELTLAGSATSVWVFQSASTLVTGSASLITVTGGASACNVFWQVADSATLGSGSDFTGTIMAKQSITATSTATIAGRLLADNGAVTLDSNVITTPTGCAPAGAVSTSPTITSGAPTATGVVGTPYSFRVTSSGTPTATYAVTGSLPTGLSLDATTGAITGTPTTPGTYTFTIAASNGTNPSASATYTIVIAGARPAELADTGADAASLGLLGALLLGAGTLVVASRRGSRRPTS